MRDEHSHSALIPARFFVVVLLLACTGASRAPAVPGTRQEAASKMPAAETILDKYINATGGKAAYRALHNILSQGTFVVTGTAVRGKYAAYEAEPNKTRTIFDFESGEVDEQGTLGEIAWERSTSGGARLLTGEEKDIALREATFNSMLNWRTIYRSAECTGVESVGDRTCYRLVLTPHKGKPLTQYYDAGSGLLVKSFITLDDPHGEIRSENLYGDYRKDNASVLFPHKLVHRITNEEMVITLDSVRCNIDIAWHRFDLPPAIKALMPGPAR